jgi:hypothetical protein
LYRAVVVVVVVVVATKAKAATTSQERKTLTAIADAGDDFAILLVVYCFES